MNGPEERQGLLDCIAILTAQHGHCPTIAEVGRCMDLPVNTAYHQLLLLRRSDAVDWEPGRPRTLHLTDKGRARLSKVVPL